MNISWLPYLQEMGDISPLPKKRGATKRRRGADGTYLEESEEVPGVLVVTWKRLLEFSSLRSCTRQVDRSKAAQ